MARTLSIVLLLPALLCACGKAPAPPAGKAAGAEVLPGTISDAMLNVDQSQSRPLLQPPPRKAGPAADASDSADDAPEAAAEPAKPATP